MPSISYHKFCIDRWSCWKVDGPTRTTDDDWGLISPPRHYRSARRVNPKMDRSQSGKEGDNTRVWKGTKWEFHRLDTAIVGENGGDGGFFGEIKRNRLKPVMLKVCLVFGRGRKGARKRSIATTTKKGTAGTLWQWAIPTTMGVGRFKDGGNFLYLAE